MGVKKIKTSEEELRDYLIQILRREFRKHPIYNEAKKEAKEDYFEKTSTGKDTRRVHFKCAMCKRFFVDREGTREITVDHVDGVIDPKVGFVDWNTYIDRMYNGRLQVLCKYPGERDGQVSCHKIKTAEERKVLAETKRRLKGEDGSAKPTPRKKRGANDNDVSQDLQSTDLAERECGPGVPRAPRQPIG